MGLKEKLKFLKNNGIVPRAVVYARFSSDNQREASIDAQLRAAKEFAKENGITIIREYVDKAKSALTDDRDSFQQMIADAETGQFHFVLVHKYDRFARNRSDSIGYRIELGKNGVTLISVVEGFDSDTPEGALLEGIIEALNEFYSRNLSREVMKGLKENAYKALYNGGTPPFGYDVDPVTQKYMLNPFEAEAVKLIFEMVKQHHSYGEILDELDKKGYKTKSGNSFKRNSLHDILTNPRYTGVYTYMRRSAKNEFTGKRNSHSFNDTESMIIVPDGMPVIIEQELFDEVQLILDNRKHSHFNNRNESCLLSGKLVCDKCKGHYSVERSKLKNGKGYTISYRCNNRKGKADEKCSNKAVLVSYIDEQVIRLLSDTLFNPALVPTLLDRYNNALNSASSKNDEAIKKLNSQIREKSKGINNILKSLERVDSEELTSHLVQLESEKKKLLSELKILEENSAVPKINATQLQNLLVQAKALFESGELSDKKRLVDIFVECVLVKEDCLEIILNQAPFVKNADYAKISYAVPRKAKK